MTEITRNKMPVQKSHLATVILLLLLVLLWIDRSRTKSAQQDLAQQRSELAQQNQTLTQELSIAHSELDFLKSGNAAMAASDKPARHERIKTESVEDPETLFLQPPTVLENDGKLTARFKFEPEENTSLPDQITLVVRVPGNTDAKIIALKTLSTSSYSDVNVLVNAQGNLGMIEGTPSDISALEFEVTVSAPVAVTVRGSVGIKDFEMDISPLGCVVRKL
jgi:cell division protein FtsB